LIHLTRDPEAGEPLHGDLIGWRKLVVGNRDWRVVWRVTFDDSGTPIVDVAEVWAVGARSDDDVYNEMRSRVDTLPKVPSTMALNEIVSRLGKVAGHLGLEDDEPAREVTPNWLRDKLVKTAGIPATQVDQMALEEAITTWENFISHPR
jgi:mRNA interferase RelE/StbE